MENNNAAGAFQEFLYSKELVASYAEILKSRPLAEKVVTKTKSPLQAKKLVARTKTRIIPETRLISVTVEDPDPESAQIYANEIVNIFTEDPGGQFGGGAPLSASVFETAVLPTEPTSPKVPQNTAIGGLLGAMLGVGMAFLLERLDNTIKNRDDAEKVLAPFPVLASVPVTKKGREVFIETDPFSHESEALRVLRTNIQFFSVDRPLKSVQITSPTAQDGKSTVAVNLAAAMAAMGSKCLLIETDLRKPILDEFFDTDQTPGLSDVLSGRVEPNKAIRATTLNNLWILPAGTIPPNPSDILGSQRMVSLLEQLEETADVIVLDSPPVLVVTDAAVLAPHVDGVIMVVKSGRSTKEAAKEAIDTLTRLDARVLGVVLNMVESDEAGYYYQYYRRTGRKAKQDPAMAYDFLRAADKPAGRRKPPVSPNGHNEPVAPKSQLADEPVVVEDSGPPFRRGPGTS